MDGKIDLCLWRDLFEGRARGDYSFTTFSEYENWNSKHPLYRCTVCTGLNEQCNGYKSLKKLMRRYEKETEVQEPRHVSG